MSNKLFCPLKKKEKSSPLLWHSYLKIEMSEVKTVDFSGTIEACDLKVGSCRQLIDFM